MPYIYEISFSVGPDQMDELEGGRTLERVLGYLRTRLPNEHGYMTSRAMHSIDDPHRTRMVFLSEWGSWEALQAHSRSSLLEDKVLQEFDPHVKAESITSRTYVEVGPEPY